MSRFDVYSGWKLGREVCVTGKKLECSRIGWDWEHIRKYEGAALSTLGFLNFYLSSVPTDLRRISIKIKINKYISFRLKLVSSIPTDFAWILNVYNKYSTLRMSSQIRLSISHRFGTKFTKNHSVWNLSQFFRRIRLLSQICPKMYFNLRQTLFRLKFPSENANFLVVNREKNKIIQETNLRVLVIIFSLCSM
jgi:hypothetical protein